METNIINNLTNFINYTYNWSSKSIHTALNQKMFDEAKGLCTVAQAQAFGALEFAVQMCIENGYPDLAKEIENKWETVWGEWFKDLIQEVL